MVKKYNDFRNPLIIAASILAVLIYSGLLKTKDSYVFETLLENRTIVRLDGEICSNQKKIGSGDFYTTDLKVHDSYSRDGFYSSCKGKIKILVPSAYVEAYMPGKLYSKTMNENAIICENGYKVSVFGFFRKDNTFVVKKATQIEGNDSLIAKFHKIRGRCRINFRRMMYSWGEAGGLLLALLSGIREYTNPELADAFRMSGLSHILALSGMHLSLFSNIAKKIGNLFSYNIVSNLIQMIAVLLFVLFAGISPSLFRALICSVSLIVCSLFNVKRIKLIEVLSFSFIIHLIFRTNDVHELAFKLSYGALAGILICGDAVKVLTASKLPVFLSDSVSASTGAQSFTAPVSLKTTGSFMPIGIISSVIVSPLINIFIYSGLVAIILCFFIPPFVPVASFYMKILYNVIKSIVLFFSGFPYLSFK